MKQVRLVFIATMSGLVVSCSTTHNTAPVVDRGHTAKVVEAPRPVVPVVVPNVAPKPLERGYYMVKRGDTLIQIALEFGQNYRDIVAWNNLANPNDIKVDQVLRVLPPEPGAPGAAQTGAVLPPSGLESRPLAVPTPGAGVPNKNVPRGEKRPYSESALAELQKPESAATVAMAPSSSAPVRTEPPKISDSKSPEKTHDVPAPNGDDDGLSWMWPAQGKIIGQFSDGRKGIDIAGKLGQPVYAAGAGKVLYAGSGIRGYGNLVIVKHTNNLLSAYAHNKTIFVKEDQTVNKGQKIAEMGNSDTDAVKLHFEIRQQGKPVDPSKFLPSR